MIFNQAPFKNSFFDLFCQDQILKVCLQNFFRNLLSKTTNSKADLKTFVENQSARGETTLNRSACQEFFFKQAQALGA